MERHKYGQADKQTDSHMDGKMLIWTDGHTDRLAGRWAVGWRTDTQRDGRTEGWTDRGMDGQMDVQTDGWMDKWINGQMDGRAEGQIGRWADIEAERWTDG
jgi:hypothetical protein